MSVHRISLDPRNATSAEEYMRLLNAREMEESPPPAPEESGGVGDLRASSIPNSADTTSMQQTLDFIGENWRVLSLEDLRELGLQRPDMKEEALDLEGLSDADLSRIKQKIKDTAQNAIPRLKLEGWNQFTSLFGHEVRAFLAPQRHLPLAIQAKRLNSFLEKTPGIWERILVRELRKLQEISLLEGDEFMIKAHSLAKDLPRLKEFLQTSAKSDNPLPKEEAILQVKKFLASKELALDAFLMRISLQLFCDVMATCCTDLGLYEFFKSVDLWNFDQIETLLTTHAQSRGIDLSDKSSAYVQQFDLSLQRSRRALTNQFSGIAFLLPVLFQSTPALFNFFIPGCEVSSHPFTNSSISQLPKESVFQIFNTATRFGYVSKVVYILDHCAGLLSDWLLPFEIETAALNGHSSIVKEILARQKCESEIPYRLSQALYGATSSPHLTHHHLAIVLFCLNHELGEKFHPSILQEAFQRIVFSKDSSASGLRNKTKIMQALLRHPKIGEIPQKVLQEALKNHPDLFLEIHEKPAQDGQNPYKLREFKSLDSRDNILASPDIARIRQGKLLRKLFSAITCQHQASVQSYLAGIQGTIPSAETLQFCLPDAIKNLPEQVALSFLTHPNAGGISSDALSLALCAACEKDFRFITWKLLEHPNAGEFPSLALASALYLTCKQASPSTDIIRKMLQHNKIGFEIHAFAESLSLILQKQYATPEGQKLYRDTVACFLEKAKKNQDALPKLLDCIAHSKHRALFLEDPATRTFIARFIAENPHLVKLETQHLLV